MLALARSFKYALDGLAHALVTQRNMRIHFAAAFLVVSLCAVIQVRTFEIIAAMVSITLVIALELVNTAVEHAVNIAAAGFHPFAKAAKDVAAAAVFVAAVNAVVVAYLIFYDKFDPIHWRAPGSLLRPPFMGVLLVGALFLLAVVAVYAVRIWRKAAGRGTRDAGPEA